MYKKSFYTDRKKLVTAGYRSLACFVTEHLQPSSMIDYGCGTGTFISEVLKLKADCKCLGLDFADPSQVKLDIPSENYKQVDLGKPIEVDQEYDIAVSIEVCEHLHESLALQLVDTLCKSAPVILFSAAIPYQPGTNHINRQWQSYYAKKFQSLGYTCHDVFRNLFWDDDKAPYWFAQNLFLYVRHDLQDTRKLGTIHDLSPYNMPLDLVHPSLLQQYAEPSQITLSRAWYIAARTFTVGRIFETLKRKLSAK